MTDQTAILQYSFLEYFYFGNTKKYESILCECLNKSIRMKEIGGSEFSLILQQHDRQDDAKALNYSLDFKLLISGSLAEFQSLTTKKAHEIAKGVYSFTYGKPTKQETVFLLNMCRNITQDKLDGYRSKPDKASKDVVRFFDKSLDKPKNIFVFLPAYIETVNQTLSVEEQFATAQIELSDSLKYIFDFRNRQQPDFDTYFAYIMNIPIQSKFVVIINRFCKTGFEEIDRVNFFSLPTVQEIAKIYVL